MILLVTDLGSSSGTRFTPGKKGLKMKLDALPPGGTLYLGAYILTYKLGEPPAAEKVRKKSGFFAGLFG